jgi:hypothetical protein
MERAMKKLLTVVIALALVGSFGFALADPVYIMLNTVIAPFSSLTINSGNPTVTVTVGQPTTVPYAFSGNELVDISITSDNDMNLVHIDVPNVYIPYSIAFDYDGEGPQEHVAVSNGVPTPLVDTNGVYNLVGDFIITVEDGFYLEGEYRDIITFAITSR